jgi:putative restriction endonuclease
MPDTQPGERFVVQRHQARTLHYDFRLSKDGVFKSWAVPKGLPEQAGIRRLALVTKDHDLAFGDFEGTIPAGEYGAGSIEIWDRGEYTEMKWSDERPPRGESRKKAGIDINEMEESLFMKSADYWLEKFSKLRIDSASGDPAPHKPLLLLVILDLAQEGILPSKTLPLTPELASRFLSYSAVVAKRRTQRLDIRYPFHHLSGDGVWTHLDQNFEKSPHRKLTRYAELPSDFVHFASDPASRDRARHLLIAKYFPPSERIALYELIGLPIPSDIEIEQNAAYRSAEDAKQVGREAKFRIRVLAAYDYTCALTGHRLTTINGVSIVDAAHIHQFSDSRNNDLGNGIALCKNAHWLFDKGLWTIADDFRVMVASSRFAESGKPDLLLGNYHGAGLRLPDDHALWPSPAHIAWHRKAKFDRD